MKEVEESQQREGAGIASAVRLNSESFGVAGKDKSSTLLIKY